MTTRHRFRPTDGPCLFKSIKQAVGDVRPLVVHLPGTQFLLQVYDLFAPKPASSTRLFAADRINIFPRCPSTGPAIAKFLVVFDCSAASRKDEWRLAGRRICRIPQSG